MPLFDKLANKNFPSCILALYIHFLALNLPQALATEFISNVCASPTDNIMQLLEMGVLDILSSLIIWLVERLTTEPQSTDATTDADSDIAMPLRMALDSAVWAFGNIAGDSLPTRTALHRSEAIDAMLHIFAKSSSCVTPGLLGTSLWAFGNMARGSFPPFLLPSANVAMGALDIGDKAAVADALFLLSQLSAGDDENQTYIANVPGLISKVLDLMVFENVVSETALRTIGNLLAGDAQVTNLVIELGAIEPLIPLLKHKKRSVKKAAVWAFSNILADSSARITFCVQRGVIADLMDEIINGNAADVANEAYWCITNSIVDAPPAELKAICLHPYFLPCYSEAIVHQNENLSRHALTSLDKILNFGANIGILIHRSTEAFYDESLNPFVEYLYTSTSPHIEEYIEEGSGHPSIEFGIELDEWLVGQVL